MANETIITVIGNITADPELRFTQNGLGVANFTIASTPRTFDKTTNDWKDGEALFLRCSIWRDAAEHVAGSLTKGTRVIAQGRLTQKSYTNKEGEKRTSIELEVDAIGPDLRYATVSVTKTGKGAGTGPSSPVSASASEPWASEPPASPTGGTADVWATGQFSDDTPF